MEYPNMTEGVFLRRPNRFVAQVEIAGQEETVHVKNTGRCRELLPPGARVWCQKWDKTSRKTKFDLITVQKNQYLINMDSQAPNAAVKEWLEQGGLGKFDSIRPEQRFGDSRFDFYLEQNGKGMYMEVKGVTLEEEGICHFPDAPTLRGAKHLRELVKAKQAGFDAAVLFVIQMKPVRWLEPNDQTDPEFGKTLREAAQNGVQVLAVDCRITETSMEIADFVEVRL
jgi:sugar fermentation stimulation protein A